MDTLTHALSGALLARATAGIEKPALPLGRRVAIGALVAAFPDADIVATWISPLSYLYHHRGVTHSLVMLPVWTVLLAWLLALIWRGGPNWRTYAPVVALSLFIHIAGDWITTFGTMIFAPLSDYRRGIGTTFIIDLWFTGIILAGLALSLLWRRSRWPAVAGLGVLAAYVVFQFVQLQGALDFGERAAREQGLSPVKVSALPRPVSPFNWMVILESDTGYRYSHVIGDHGGAGCRPDRAAGCGVPAARPGGVGKRCALRQRFAGCSGACRLRTSGVCILPLVLSVSRAA